MATASPAAKTEVSVTFSNPPTPESTVASNASIGGAYMPDFGEVYVRGNKCIASNKRRTRCGHTNVSTSEEQEELKPWPEKSEKQKLLHRYCPQHRKEKQRELAERKYTPGSDDTVERPHRPDLVSPLSSMGTQSPGGTAPAAHNIQALYPGLGGIPAQASHSYRPATATDTGGSSVPVTESQPRLPPLPPRHAASARCSPHQSVFDPFNTNSEARLPPNLPHHHRDPSFSLSPHVSEAQMRREIADIKAEEVARNRDHINSGTRLPGNRVYSMSGNGPPESFNVPGNYYRPTGHDSRPLQSHNEPAPQSYYAAYEHREIPIYQHSSIPTPTSYRPTVTPDGRCITCKRFQGEAFRPLHTEINRNYDTIDSLEANIRVLREENKAHIQRMMSLSLGTDERTRE